MRLAVEIVRAPANDRAATLIMYRISALDLVEGGVTHAEILELAQAMEADGVDGLNTGIGWHEARVPTVAYVTPRAAWAATVAIKRRVNIPVIRPTASTSRHRREPHRDRRRRPGVDGASRSWPTPNSPQGARPAGSHQHLHRLQPGLPRLHLPDEPRPAWSTRARCARSNSPPATQPSSASP